MKTNIETLLDYSIQIRKYYARVLNERLKDLKLSPNEMNILFLLAFLPFFEYLLLEFLIKYLH